jgi:hypothetical protein
VTPVQRLGYVGFVLFGAVFALVCWCDGAHPARRLPRSDYSVPPGGALIDPFGGSGTTGLAAKIAEVDATLIEIDPDVVRSASRRITDDAPLFAEGAA